MKLNQEKLKMIHRLTRNDRAWLTKALNRPDLFDKEDLAYLEELEDDIVLLKNQEKEFVINANTKIREFIAEIGKEDPKWVEEKRLENIVNKLEKDIEDKKPTEDVTKNLNILRNFDSQINSFMIERARQFPIEKLVKINKRGFASCLFHNDGKTPNMYCKNNFYYCFTCGAKGSAIDLYMHLHCCNFIEAVKAMQ